MKKVFRLSRIAFKGFLGLFLIGLLAVAATYFYLAPNLPSTDVLKDVRLQVPLRIYTQEGELIAEFGEKRRRPIRYEDVPPQVVQAVLAAEDDRFFEHPGVDYQGIARAVVQLVKTGRKAQGGSTITMQVARNFFLSSERTYLRKLNEILLSFKIEQELSKEEILELYLNKIYLGNRSYGVAAAAHVYYGKDIQDLTLAEVAMIAGLPKAPSSYNPVINPSRALLRRDYVLGRMHNLGFIDDDAYQQALVQPDAARLHAQSLAVPAPYVAEMVRSELVATYGEEAYNLGLNVYTTISGPAQRQANQAVRAALLSFDRRHGYKGPEAQLSLAEDAGIEQWREAIADYRSIGDLLAALVVGVEEQALIVYAGGEETLRIEWPELAWAKPYLDETRQGPAPTRAAQVAEVGDVVRVEMLEDGRAFLAQVPEVAGALVALRPKDGAVHALVGGFDFPSSKFNRATQAERQPGSSFKPFVYSAALLKGFTPASVINDAPVVFEDGELETAWRPGNYSGQFYGPTRLREALVRSRNLVSIRVLRSSGIRFTVNHLSNFGISPDKLPRDLSLALGSGSLTPMELTRGYSVFANGGFLIEPYLIQRVESSNGEILSQANPLVACLECEQEASDPEPAEELPLPEDAGFLEAHLLAEDNTAPEVEPVRLAPRTLSAHNAYLMTNMMQDVIRRGTGRKALQLGRNDLAGKTGTTNDQRDAWFAGFNAEIAATAWIGFDTPRAMGSQETGAGAALPMWIDFMAGALAGVPESPLVQPPGLVTVRIDPETGKIATPNHANGIFEIFAADNLPESENLGLPTGGESGSAQGNTLTEELF